MKKEAGTIGGVVIAAVVYFLVRTIFSGGAATFDRATPTPTPTSYASVTFPTIEPVKDLFIDARYFLIDEVEGLRWVEAVHYGRDTKTMKSIEDIFVYSKDYYDTDELYHFTDTDWNDYVEGFSGYDFADVSISDTGSTVTVTFVLHDLDDGNHLQALYDGGYLSSWEGGKDDVADANAYMSGLRKDGATEIGDNLAYMNWQITH